MTGENRPWFEAAFDRFYIDLYAHRDATEAEQLLAALAGYLPPDGPVLDVACGGGRLVRALARVYEPVVGIDLSWDLLRSAARGGGGRWVRADMRSLPAASGRYAAAFSLFTSFGYFATPEEDWQVVREVVRALRPGGAYVLDFLNAPVALRELVPESHQVVAGRDVASERRYDAAAGVLRKRVRVSRSGRIEREYEERVRMHAPDALRAGFLRSGLSIRLELGSYDGRPFEADRSPRCILVGRKEPR